jgi:hypothetical protein
VDPSRDGFDARKYLGDLHTQTSYADLQQGARTLRSLLRGQEMQLKVPLLTPFTHPCLPTIRA